MPHRCARATQTSNKNDQGDGILFYEAVLFFAKRDMF